MRALGVFVMIGELGCHTQARDPAADQGPPAVARTFPEPVPGRGEALLAWVCGDSKDRDEPMCREWAGKHRVRRRKSR
jgi:hypothetical protein